MKIKSIKNVDITNKRVLVRVDFNVPLENGEVSDAARIEATLPTLQYLLEKQAKIILMSHLGRPKGKHVPELVLNPVAKKVSELTGKEVKKMDACIGPEVEKAVNEMAAGEIIILENTRFNPEEMENEAEFTKQLASLGDIFVSDCFGVAHRAHASIYGIAKHLPAYGGFLIQKEVEALSKVMKEVPRPFTIVMGGAKIDTKIGIMENFIGKADNFLVGGGLANTFLAAQGFNVGNSLYQPTKIERAQKIMMKSEALHGKFLVPTDAIVADDINEDATTIDIPIKDIEGDMKILDIGKQTITQYKEIIKNSKTIIWNGPMGLFEMEPFSHGTCHIAIAIAESEAKTIVGGGDSVKAIQQFGIDESKYSHISTGGGAMLQFLEGTTLPGLEVLMEE